jgi:lipid-A-disaccharide synthase
LIQQDCIPQNIAAELDSLLNNQSYRQKMLENYNLLDEKMGAPGASAKTAELIIRYALKK